MSNVNNFTIDWIKGIDGIGEDNIVSICSNSSYVYVAGYYDSSASGITISDTITLPQTQGYYSHFIIQFDHNGIIIKANAIRSLSFPPRYYNLYNPLLITCTETHVCVSSMYNLFIETDLGNNYKLQANAQGQQGYGYLVTYSSDLNTVNYVKTIKNATSGGFLLFSRVHNILTNNESSGNYIYWTGNCYGSNILIEGGTNGISGFLPIKYDEATIFIVKIDIITGNIIFSYGIPSDRTDSDIKTIKITNDSIYIGGVYRIRSSRNVASISVIDGKNNILQQLNTNITLQSTGDVFVSSFLIKYTLNGNPIFARRIYGNSVVIKSLAINTRGIYCVLNYGLYGYRSGISGTEFIGVSGYIPEIDNIRNTPLSLQNTCMIGYSHEGNPLFFNNLRSTSFTSGTDIAVNESAIYVIGSYFS